MNVNNPILEFTDVTVAAAVRKHAGLGQVNARFRAGTLAIIQVEPGNEQLPLADLAEGLLCPEKGLVSFQGEAWTTMLPEQVLRRRAQIGRVFDGHGWISNLNVNENVTLSQRHHTRRPNAEILAEAEALAHAFGLSELPKTRPALVSHQNLRRAEWIRAFLGQPLLVLLERPMQGVPLEFMPHLISAAKTTAARGAALLWLTDDDRVWQNPDLWDAPHYAMRGQTLTTVEATGRTGKQS